MPCQPFHAGIKNRLLPAICIIIIVMNAGTATAAPSFSPDQGKMPLKIQFTLPGGDHCDHVTWEFGDGSTSSEVNPSHTYTTMGFYYPRCICTLPGAIVTYAFDKVVSSNADMPDPDSADQHYPIETDPLISSEPLSLDDQIRQGDGLFALGLYQNAADSYKKAIQLSGSDPAVLGKYGDILAGLSRWSEAAEIYNQSLMQKPDPAVYNAYGASLIKLNRYEQALDSFNTSLEIDPDNGSTYTGIGKAYELLKLPEQAAEAYKRAVELDGTQTPAWIGYGNVLNSLEQYSESAKAYEKAISLGVSGADIYTRYGGVLRKLGRDGDANKAMSTARSFQGPIYSGSDDYIPRCSAGGALG